MIYICRSLFLRLSWLKLNYILLRNNMTANGPRAAREVDIIVRKGWEVKRIQIIIIINVLPSQILDVLFSWKPFGQSQEKAPGMF